MGASVKIMLSHDYCHFEICKSTDQEVTDQQINELRKDVQRLADEAVRQYSVAKRVCNHNQRIEYDKELFLNTCKRYAAVAEERRTPEMKAHLKAQQDANFMARFRTDPYDYEDEFDIDEDSYSDLDDDDLSNYMEPVIQNEKQ